MYAGFGDGAAFGPWLRTHMQRKAALDSQGMLAVARRRTDIEWILGDLSIDASGIEILEARRQHQLIDVSGGDVFLRAPHAAGVRLHRQRRGGGREASGGER